MRIPPKLPNSVPAAPLMAAYYTKQMQDTAQKSVAEPDEEIRKLLHRKTGIEAGLAQLFLELNFLNALLPK